MAIVWTDVEAIAPELVGLVPVPTQTYFLAKVDREIDDTAWDDIADDGRRYLAAHLATRYVAGASGASSAGAVGPIASETLGPMSRSYGTLGAMSGSSQTGDLTTTRYGLEYLRMINLLPSALGFVP